MKKLTTKKRVALIGLLALGLVCTATGGSLYSVDAAPADAPSFAIKTTASIRTVAPAGIRFETTIAKTEYETLKANGATFGTVVQSEALYEQNGNELVLGQEESVNIPATNWKILDQDDPETTDVNEGTHNQYNAVLVGEKDPVTGEYAGLPQELYGVRLVARSYVTYADGTTEYGDNIAIRSIADVAKAAILDTTVTYGDDEYDYFHDITDYVANQNALTAVEVNVTATEINGEVALDTSYGEVKAVYVLDGNDTEVAADDWAYADGTLTFTADYLKTLPCGEYTLKLFTENAVLSLPTTVYGESTLGYERLLGFDNSKTVSNVKYENAPVWLEEYQGAKGVVKFTMSDIWAGLQFALPYTVAELQAMEWDYFEIRMFTEMSGDIYEENWPNATQGAWGTVKLAKSDVATIFGTVDTFYDKLVNGIDNSARLFAFWNAGTFYIDHVDLKSYNTSGVFDFADPISNADMLSPANAEWISSFEGASGVVKGTYTGDYSATITLKGDTTLDNLQSLTWEVLVVRVWFEETEANASATKPDPVKDNWNFNGLGSAPRAQWVSLCITKANLAAQFGDIDTFYNAFISSNGALLTEVYNTAKSSIYIDSVSLMNYDRVMDFESADEISFLRSGTDAEWKESATCDKGTTENGVISYYHGTTMYAGVKFQFNNYTGLTLDDWDKIQIRIRIIRGSNASQPGTDGSFSAFYIGNTSVSIGSINEGWSTLTITKQQIEDSDQYTASDFWSAFTSEDGARLFWLYYVHEAPDWTIQISSISLVKNS